MHFRRLQLAFAILLLSALPLSAQVQKPAPQPAQVWAEWASLSPENEEFTILMPKDPTTESSTFSYHKMELSARSYLATSSAGPVLAVVSLSGIKSDPAQYTEFARFNSYMDAFKSFFPAKVRTKETPARLTLVSSRPFHGHTGRSYKMTLGDLSGSVHAFVTRKRFYAVVSLNTKKDEALEEKFLSSFVLPDRQIEPPKNTAAAQNNVNAEGNQQAGNQVAPEGEVTLPAPAPGSEGSTEQQPATPGNNAAGADQGQKPPQPGQKRAPLAGGMLNSKAIYMPVPEVPGGEANGVVLVQVLVDEQGSVVDAKAVSGPQNLHAPAVNAARLARFTPTLLMGEPVKVTGTLSYNFGRSN